MAGEMQVDSVKVSTPLQPQDAGTNVTDEQSNQIIDFNFESNGAKAYNALGLPVMGLGVEIGTRTVKAIAEEVAATSERLEESPSFGQFVKDNIHRNAEWAKEKPYRMLVGWAPVLLDAFVNGNK